MTSRLYVPRIRRSSCVNRTYAAHYDEKPLELCEDFDQFRARRITDIIAIYRRNRRAPSYMYDNDDTYTMADVRRFTRGTRAISRIRDIQLFNTNEREKYVYVLSVIPLRHVPQLITM